MWKFGAMASRGVRVTAIPGGKGDYRGTVTMCTAGHQEQFSLAVLHAREVLQCAAVSVGHCRAPRKFCGCPNRPGAFLVGGSQVWGPDPSVPPIWRCFANLTKCSLNICHGCGQAARTVGTMGLARWRAPWRHHRRGLCTACLAWQPIGHCEMVRTGDLKKTSLQSGFGKLANEDRLRRSHPLLL